MRNWIGGNIAAPIRVKVERVDRLTAGRLLGTLADHGEWKAKTMIELDGVVSGSAALAQLLASAIERAGPRVSCRCHGTIGGPGLILVAAVKGVRLADRDATFVFSGRRTADMPAIARAAGMCAAAVRMPSPPIVCDAVSERAARAFPVPSLFATNRVSRTFTADFMARCGLIEVAR